MSPKERIWAALRLEEPDRVPVYPHGFDLGFGMEPLGRAAYGLDPYRGSPSDESYLKVVEYARKVGDPMQGWAPRVQPNVFLSASKEARRWTSSYEEDGYRVDETRIETPKGLLTAVSRTPPGGPTRHVKGLIETEEDIDRFLSVPYVPPKVDASSFHEFESKVAGRAALRCGAPTPIINVTGPQLSSSDKFAFLAYRHKERVLEMLDAMYERCIDYLESLLSQGVQAVFWTDGAELAAPPILPPRLFQEFVVRYDRGVSKVIHEYGSVVIMHCHGNVNRILEDVVETGVDGLHPVEPPPMGDTPLAEAKKRVGDRLCLVGNIEMHDILTCTPEQIDGKVRETIREAAPGGGLILSVSTGFYQFYRTEQGARNYLQFLKTGCEAASYTRPAM
ncbi:MAG: uroporphyrinogen decarboxylase family protein [Candidatus Bathyarchaeia archaeon]